MKNTVLMKIIILCLRMNEYKEYFQTVLNTEQNRNIPKAEATLLKDEPIEATVDTEHKLRSKLYRIFNKDTYEEQGMMKEILSDLSSGMKYDDLMEYLFGGTISTNQNIPIQLKNLSDYANVIGPQNNDPNNYISKNIIKNLINLNSANVTNNDFNKIRFANAFKDITHQLSLSGGRKKTVQEYSQITDKNIRKMIDDLEPYSFPKSGKNTITGLDDKGIGTTNTQYLAKTTETLNNKLNLISNLNLVLIYAYLYITKSKYWLLKGESYLDRTKVEREDKKKQIRAKD